jgi:hypothetical protein
MKVYESMVKIYIVVSIRRRSTTPATPVKITVHPPLYREAVHWSSPAYTPRYY